MPWSGSIIIDLPPTKAPLYFRFVVLDYCSNLGSLANNAADKTIKAAAVNKDAVLVLLKRKYPQAILENLIPTFSKDFMKYFCAHVEYVNLQRLAHT